MTRTVAFLVCLVSWNLSIAQDLVITNARLIDGTGRTIEQGSVVVRGGRIISASEGSADAQGTQIDARGMTVMPGFIDTHLHLLTRLRADDREALLEEIQAELLRFGL